MTIQRLISFYEGSTVADREEGKRAYFRYHEIMRDFAGHYGVPVDWTTAAFVALSPNNDYLGNLRSLASVLTAVRDGVPFDRVTVTTYRHCGRRAYGYASGSMDFLSTVKGPKIRAFYFNIVEPWDNRHVTIDGHMSCIWRGCDLTMRHAVVKSKREYNHIAEAMKTAAASVGLLPNQFQATLWLYRRALLGLHVDKQLSIFNQDDHGGTVYQPGEIVPYAMRDANE